MSKFKPYKLTNQDKKIIKIFSDLGMPHNLAKTLMYISQVDECRSAEIEHGANLRQPEVSVSIQELHRRGWIKKRDLKKKGKGRPVHIYKLSNPINDIIVNFEQQKTKEINLIKNDLKELKNLVDERQ